MKLWETGRASGLLALGLAAVASVAIVPADASAITASEAIRFLNAERAVHGLPADVAEDPAWSDGCRKHGAYYKLNGWGANPHDEDPAKPGFTPEGQKAARSAILGGGFSATGENLWRTGPIHYMQMMAPGLSVTGYGDDGWGCLWTWPGYQRPKPATTELYSIPGEGTEVATSLTAVEWPYTPGDKVGLPPGAETGPYLYLFGFGPGFSYSVASATLAGPAGPVEVRIANNDAVGGYLPPGGIVIPVRPLAPGAVYTASATVADQTGATTARTWTFRTKASEKPPIVARTPSPTPTTPQTKPKPQTIAVTARRSGKRLKLVATTSWPGREQKARFRFEVSQGRVNSRRALWRKPSEGAAVTFTLRRAAGGRVTLRVGGLTVTRRFS